MLSSFLDPTVFPGVPGKHVNSTGPRFAWAKIALQTSILLLVLLFFSSIIGAISHLAKATPRLLCFVWSIDNLEKNYWPLQGGNCLPVFCGELLC